MKVFISKWALTGGIEEAGGIIVRGSSGTEYFKQARGGAAAPLLTVGKDVHATREAAVKAAEFLRERKLASLRRQIAKIESLDFNKEGGNDR